MRLIDSLKSWIGGGPPQTGSQTCPQEIEILKYVEKKLSAKGQARLENHFADCNDCRDLLALLARFSPEELKQQTPLSEAEIQQQTATYIQAAQSAKPRRTPDASNRPVRPVPQPAWSFRFTMATVAAMAVIGALAIGAYWMMHRESALDSARGSLALALKDGRRSQAYLSGGFPYSTYHSTRGATDSPDLYLKLAVNQLQAAENENAPVEMRQMLARTYLAYNHVEQAQKARNILQSLLAHGVQTADVFNDLGIAQLQLQKNDEAIASFNRALEINSAYAEALFNRALAKNAQGDYSGAKHDWQQFVQISTDDKWKAEALANIDSLANYSSAKYSRLTTP
jgi:tetratricopeptide (TPR) repeat protein